MCLVAGAGAGGRTGLSGRGPCPVSIPAWPWAFSVLEESGLLCLSQPQQVGSALSTRVCVPSRFLPGAVALPRTPGHPLPAPLVAGCPPVPWPLLLLSRSGLPIRYSAPALQAALSGVSCRGSPAWPGQVHCPHSAIPRQGRRAADSPCGVQVCACGRASGAGGPPTLALDGACCQGVPQEGWGPRGQGLATGRYCVEVVGSLEPGARAGHGYPGSGDPRVGLHRWEAL